MTIFWEVLGEDLLKVFDLNWSAEETPQTFIFLAIFSLVLSMIAALDEFFKYVNIKSIK